MFLTLNRILNTAFSLSLEFFFKLFSPSFQNCDFRHYKKWRLPLWTFFSRSVHILRNLHRKQGLTEVLFLIILFENLKTAKIYIYNQKRCSKNLKTPLVLIWYSQDPCKYLRWRALQQ